MYLIEKITPGGERRIVQSGITTYARAERIATRLNDDEKGNLLYVVRNYGR